LPIENAAQESMLDYRLRTEPEMIEIGEADAIDATRKSGIPPPPDQSSDIEQ
jgi:hypothetical protein